MLYQTSLIKVLDNKQLQTLIFKTDKREGLPSYQIRLSSSITLHPFFFLPLHSFYEGSSMNLKKSVLQNIAKTAKAVPVITIKY